MSTPRLAPSVLLALTVACSARRVSPQKISLVNASPATSSAPQASVSGPAVIPAPARASASCTPQRSAALDARNLQVGPASKPLSPQLGLWLADERSALLSETVEAAWAVGPTSVAGPNSATRAVVMARLPRPLRAWLGRPIRVLGANGAVCDTRLQRFLIRAQITPDLATAEHWEGCADELNPTPEAVAAEVWRLSATAGRSLIAEFSAPCKGALLAVDPDRAAPAIAAPEPASADLGDALVAAFRQLPAYAQIQARFHAEHPELDGAWDDHDARRSISTLQLPGQARLAFVSEEVGSGCRGFSASLSALWVGDGPARAIAAIDDRRLTPNAIVDLGKGSVVLLGSDGPFHARSRLEPPNYERVFSSIVPFFRGPC